MKKFVEEFKTFIARGNVLDMAVGVIIGGSFGKITTSLVNDVIMPVITWLCGSADATALNVTVRPEVLNEAGEVTQAAVVIGFGTFISTILDFLLVALVVFGIVKAFNKARSVAEAKKKAEEEAKAAAEAAAAEAEAAAAEPEEPKPTTEELLAQILEQMKNK